MAVNRIEVKDVSKSFGDKQAVKKISFSVHTGEIFGLLGANGAGKTTLFRMMTTLLLPDSGEISIAGKPIDRHQYAIKREIGMVSQHYSLQSEMTVREILQLHGKLHGMSKAKRRARIDELLKFADLWADQNQLAKHLSGGMKRKLMIIRAIMHNPSIVFLDEPTVGLDPVSRRQVWALLMTLKQNQMTIILTTHYMEEAEKLCDRVLLMHLGEKMMQDAPENLIEQNGRYTVEYMKETKELHAFFKTQADAKAYADALTCDFSIRKSSLEDVLIQMLEKRMV